jgi:hypothetical protein
MQRTNVNINEKKRTLGNFCFIKKQKFGTIVVFLKRRVVGIRHISHYNIITKKVNTILTEYKKEINTKINKQKFINIILNKTILQFIYYKYFKKKLSTKFYKAMSKLILDKKFYYFYDKKKLQKFQTKQQLFKKILELGLFHILKFLYKEQLNISTIILKKKKDHNKFSFLQNTFKNVSWVVIGQINLSNKKFISKSITRTLSRSIRCPISLILINLCLEFSQSTNQKLLELLNTLYFFDLDLFMKNLMLRNSTYFLKTKVLNNKTIPAFLSNSSVISYHYFRNKNNFILGISGNISNQELYYNKFILFLKKTLKLEFNSLERVPFTTNTKILFENIWIIKKLNKQSNTNKILLYVNIQNVLEKLKINGFLKKKKKYQACNFGKIIVLSHLQILVYYNQFFKKIKLYYSFAINFKKILKIVKYHLKTSCALTLALKLKLRRKSKVYKLFGKNLKCPKTNVKLNF